MMSFILDALKKSEQGRRLQQKEARKRKVFNFSAKRSSRHRGSSWAWIALLVIVLCVLAGLGIVFWGGEPQAGSVDSRSVEVRSRIVKASPPAVVNEEQTPAFPATAVAPAVTLPGEVAPVPRPVSRQLAVESETKKTDSLPRADSEPLPVAPKIHSYTELLRLHPGLQVSMHYYSNDAQKSILRLNGVLLHEQESSADGLLISEITADGALVQYGGLLYELRRPGG